MRAFTILILLCLVFTQLIAIPPDPPLGKRWVVNHAFSDEFNGTELDDSKWHNYHPQWKGRAPGLFMKENVSVKDGYLVLRNHKLEKDSVVWNWNNTATTTYTIGGAAIRSKSNQAYFGYYECRAKASKTRMSTTFWLSSDHTEKIEGCASGKEKYGLELDIQECIGLDDAPKTSTFHKGMHSNTHFHYTTCEGDKDTRSRGNGFSSDISCSDTFNIYAAWWKNENEVEFVFNDTERQTVLFRTDILSKPFNFPMCMNMVSETYSWISTPRTENLNDETKNKSLYDWVRSYVLMDVEEELAVDNNLITNGDFETGSDSGWGGWGGNPREVTNNNAFEGQYCMHIGGTGAPEQTLSLEPNTNYTLTAYVKAVKGAVKLGVKNNESGKHLKEVSISDTEYKKYTVDFTTDDGSNFKVFLYAPKDTDEGYLDNVVLMDEKETEVEETIMFPEEVSFTAKPSLMDRKSSIYFKSKYMANADREFSLEILDESNQVIANEVYKALAGFGKHNLEFTKSDQLQLGVNYKAKIYIRPLNSTDNSSAYGSDEFSFKFDPTAVKELENSGLKIYPNPVNSNLKISGLKTESTFTIYQMNGMTVLKGTIKPEESIHVKNLDKGMYIITIGETKNLRFVKQ